VEERLEEEVVEVAEVVLVLVLVVEEVEVVARWCRIPSHCSSQNLLRAPGQTVPTAGCIPQEGRPRSHRLARRIQ
jgi:hypothetical protein